MWLDGRRRKVVGPTKEAAAKAMGRLLHGDPAERHADRRARVGALLEDWLARGLANRERASSTTEVHTWAARLLTGRLGTVRLADLDVHKVERALAVLATEDGLSRASLVKIRSTLRQALSWAERRRLIAHNPAAAAELPAAAPGTRPKRAMAADELGRLLNALDDHPWGAMYALMVRVGLRPGEAAGVCADALDLDADPPTVAVVRAVHLERGRPVLGEDLKTAGARRRLAMPRDVVELLRPLTEARPHGPLFTAQRGGLVWPSTMRTELVAACERAGIERISPNELRHTAATLLVERGLAPHEVADILGHRSTRMVDAVYRHRPPVIRGAEQ